MARAIDADELLRELTCNFAGVPFHGNRKLTVSLIRRHIEAAPTIDPESLRPHGRWVCVNLAYGRYECSVCHAADEDCSDYYGAHNVTGQDFCPYCGAKMDGGETDEAK